MTENLKARLDFPNVIVQAQTVRSLVGAVLREKGSHGPISASSPQGPAWEALWEQCCSGAVLVCSVCCDAVVLLVEEGHADHHFVLTRVLNLLPSARNVQGLIHIIGRMLQRDVDHKDQQTDYVSPYSIRNNPHPFITVLENRVDCWPSLLLEIQDCIQLAIDRDSGAYITMLVPFLRYLYCDPQRPPQHALLRQALLRVLLSGYGLGHQDKAVSHTLMLSMLQLVPHIEVDSVEAVLEICGFVDVLLKVSAWCSPDCWMKQRVALVRQLLCICQQSLRLNGDCRPVISLIQQLLPGCRQELPLDELLMGVALLLLEAPAVQQSALLNLALSLSSEELNLSPWISPVLVLPVLQLLSFLNLTDLLAHQRTLHLNQSLANRLLLSISRIPDRPTKLTSLPPPPVSSWYSELSVALSILRKVTIYPGAAADWLLSVSSSLSSNQRLSPSLSLMVTHVIMTGQDDICRLALKTCQDMASADPSQVPSLIPVLLFKLSKEKSPAQVHAVLSCLPNMGTHKHCVSMVLQILHNLTSAPKLRAVAMRLLTALWKKQERVYPDLQRLLGQLDNKLVGEKDAIWQQALSRAACLRDICKVRPYQHGGDMLAAIVVTLKQCKGEDLVTPAMLVMEGLQELCRTEVVDIISMWRSLGPDLRGDSRPLMIKSTAELLALIPQLAVQSTEYQSLKDEVVSFLWELVTSKDPDVSSCGFKALAVFPEESHTISVFPEAARPPTKPQEADEDEQKKQEEEKEQDLSVPASSYLRLMTLTPTPVQPAFELFLTSLVKQEMSQMPRGVYFSALKAGGLRSGQGKTVAGIPSFIMKSYEKNNQPGLKPGLAAALLLCYELPVQTDRDGRPIARFLVSRSRSFQQMLTGLILEVSIQLSDWHRALCLPQAWRAFMSKAFNAVLQGRRAELEMLQKQGKEPLEDLQYKQQCSWLWARDQLTDVIKAAIKDSPVVQGNSILAMSGLASVVYKYENNLLEDRDGPFVAGPEFVSTESWFDMVLETMLSISSSSSYKPRGQVLPWFLHRSYSGENTASVISRSCASLSLSVLVQVLVSYRRDSLAQVLSVLQAALPYSPNSDDTQAIQFHSGLALGMVLSSVYQQRLSDVSAQKDSDLLSTALNALESCSFNPDLEYNTGCTLGLGLVLSTLCRTAQSDQHVHIIQTLDRLQVSLEKSSGQGCLLQEILSYCVACVTVSAFTEGLIDATKAEDILNSLRSLAENSQQSPGLSLALGLMIHGLSVSGHGKAQDLHPRLLAAWIQILMSEGCPTMLRLAAVNGLVALVGSERYLVQEKNEEELSSNQQSRLNEVIRAITQVISFSGAIGLQSNSFCLLAHLHLAHMSTSLSHSAVPQDFTYLSEKSIIRSIVDFIIEAGRKGPDFSHPTLVKTALASLSSNGSSFQYPPINWSAILFPLMRLNFGGDVQHQCVVLATSQAQSSQSASAFLGSWISPPLVHSLSLQTVGHLYKTLGHWMKHVSEEKLQMFLEVLVLQQFQPKLRLQRLDLCCSILKGLGQAMALPNPPNHCWSLLCSTTEKIFTVLPNTIQDNEVDLYVDLAICLSEMSDTEINRIASVSETEVEKTCFILAYLTSQGRVPLLSLNDVITGVLHGWPSQRVGWFLLQTFYQCRFAANPKTDVTKRMEWLLELMGHIRNVAFGATSIPSERIKQATYFLFQVFAAAVISWSDHLMPLLLGVRAQWFPVQPDSEPLPLNHRLYGEESLTGSSLSQCLLGLSHSLPLLMNKEPWRSQTHKFVDWLLSLTEAPEENLSASTMSSVKAAVSALSSSPEFRKKAVWTKAYGW